MFDGVKHLDVAGPAEAFAEAARIGADYRLRYVSLSGQPVETSTGMSIAVHGSIETIPGVDTVVVPGGDCVPVAPLEPAFLAACTELISRSSRVVSVCTGAFLLASVGVLDGRRATTHWMHAGLLGRIYPAVDVVDEALFVTDGRFRTSAGVAAGIDLALSLVEEDYGEDLAREVARRLVVHMRRSGGQSQFSRVLETSRGRSSAVRSVVDAVNSDPAQSYTAIDLARISGVSHRHLTRLFQEEIGITPAKHIEQMRLEAAKALLLAGHSVAEASLRSGFRTNETLRRKFTDQLGIPPSEFQRRFINTTGASS